MQVSRNAEGHVAFILNAEEAQLMATLLHASGPSGNGNIRRRFIKAMEIAFGELGVKTLFHASIPQESRLRLEAYPKILEP